MPSEVLAFINAVIPEHAEKSAINNAYRYRDWELTVPLLLMEIMLVMELLDGDAAKKCVTLGINLGVMIIFGCLGEPIVSSLVF